MNPYKAFVCAALLALSGLANAAQDPAPRQEGIDAYDVGNYATAIARLTPLAAGNDGEVLWRLGLMAVLGKGMKKNYPQAMQYFLQAANAGHARAHFDVGLMYQLGEGRERDADKARQWYELGAALDCGPCDSELGLLQVEDKVVTDPAMAERWFSLAADNGDARGLQLLAMLRLGQRGEDATAEALDLLQKPSDHGRQYATYLRARLLWSSHQSPDHPQIALQEYRRLIASGYFYELPDRDRTRIWLQMMLSAASGWGMPQDSPQYMPQDPRRALEYAKEADRILERNEDTRDGWYLCLTQLYPTYDWLKKLLDARTELQMENGHVTCETVDTLLSGAMHHMIPLTDADRIASAIRQLKAEKAECADFLDVVLDLSCKDDGDPLNCYKSFLAEENLLPPSEAKYIGFRAE